MKQLIFTVYDSKAEAYLAPFTTKTLGLAERMFQELVNQDGHQFNRFPGDYTLFCVGEWNEATGVCQAIEPINMGAGITHREADLEVMHA